MDERFIAISSWRRPDLRPLADRMHSHAKAHGFRVVLDSSRLLVLASAPLAALKLPDTVGVILGRLYRRAEPSDAVEELSSALDAQIVLSQAHCLIEDFWGRYLAILQNPLPSGVTVLRDPSGAIPAYSLSVLDLDIVCSDLGLLLDLGWLKGELDSEFLHQHLAFPHLRGRQTGIAGVRELLAGVRHGIGERSSETCYWDPWMFACGPQREDFQAAAKGLAHEVSRCATALRSPYRRPLLELSGGLDSSILAACLSEADHPIAAINLATEAADGDERAYAAAVADRTGLRLLVESMGPDGVELGRRRDVLLPRPGSHAILQSIEATFMTVAIREKADAFVSGTGGDNVFCALSTAAPAVDASRMHGFGAAFWSAIADVASVHRCTRWRAAELTLRKILRGPSPLWRRNATFLNPDALPDAPPSHPWLYRAQHHLPGKLEHIQSLIVVQSYQDGYARSALAPMLFPLLAQPVVELCLSIPTWLWVQGGMDRAVARAAFADALPASVIHRRTKGRLESIAVAIFIEQRERLRALLLDGHLAEIGLINRAAVAAYLDVPGPPRDVSFYRLLQLAEAEAWARSWTSAAPSRSPV
jgi:asparagine synthase (glutamine-hydrolysing)